jgi:hypothetical protein
MKPPQISRAITLLWISVAISFAAIPLEWSFLRSISSVVSILLQDIFTAGVFAFFIWKIGQGRNWARVTFLVMFVLGALLSLWALPKAPSFPRIGWIIFIVQAALQAYALLLMFVGPGKAFFAGIRIQKQE